MSDCRERRAGRVAENRCARRRGAVTLRTRRSTALVETTAGECRGVRAGEAGRRRRRAAVRVPNPFCARCVSQWRGLPAASASLSVPFRSEPCSHSRVAPYRSDSSWRVQQQFDQKGDARPAHSRGGRFAEPEGQRRVALRCVSLVRRKRAAGATSRHVVSGAKGGSHRGLHLKL